MGTGSDSQGVKLPGRGVDHLPPSSAEVKERVALYLRSPSGLLLDVIGTKTFTLFILTSWTWARCLSINQGNTDNDPVSVTYYWNTLVTACWQTFILCHVTATWAFHAAVLIHRCRLRLNGNESGPHCLKGISQIRVLLRQACNLPTAMKECSIDQQKYTFQSWGQEHDVNDLGLKCLGRPENTFFWWIQLKGLHGVYTLPKEKKIGHRSR
jgi:hypothetical protein